MLGFSAQAPLSLADTGTNTLRAFLVAYLESIPERLESAALPQPMSTSEPAPQSETYVSPMLSTAWNQTNPYNLLMPEVTGAPSGYDGRAPVGCVATAYAQILNHHRWPLHGVGGESYSDTAGEFTGSYSVTFDTVYDWDNMLPGYSVFGYNQPEAADAVSKLMWDLVVAKHANIEADETSANTLFLGQQLSLSHFMENPQEVSGGGAEAALQAELLDGYPGMITIPGHAVVADGLDMDGGTPLYHIQYGWGGTNDGWFSASGIPGGAVSSVLVGIRPALMPFALTPAPSAPANQSVTLPWIFPRHRADEISAIRLHRLDTQSGNLTLKLADRPHVIAQDWEIVTDVNRGQVWFAGPAGPATLDFSECFIPTAASTLTFSMQYRLGSATLSLQISTDGGESFDTLHSVNDNFSLSWANHNVSLAAYAGETVQVRFHLGSGSFYPDNGGVWIDTLSITDTQSWTQWAFWREEAAPDMESFSSESQILDEAEDFSFPHDSQNAFN